jgi:hypothetical protein
VAELLCFVFSFTAVTGSVEKLHEIENAESYEENIEFIRWEPNAMRRNFYCFEVFEKLTADIRLVKSTSQIL